MMKENEKLISVSDIILLCIVFLVCGVIVILLVVNKEKGLTAKIMVDGDVVKQMELYQDDEYFVQTDKGSNLVIVEDGTVYVFEADCPDKVCVSHKPISMTGETIICLPHKLVIEIVE